MHVAFLNPQGNFDPEDRYLTQHPDFGGQLVYVKQVARALAEAGHRVDIVTRLVDDERWPGFAAPLDAYPDAPGLRIVRLPAGGPAFLAKERLWPHLGSEWVPGILDFYAADGGLPDAFTGHYADGGLAAALIEDRTGLPFTFTAHSLGAQKLDKLRPGADLAALDARYRFGVRIAAERLAMNRSAFNVTSTRQEASEQYGHPAYTGAADPADPRRTSVIPPGVNLATFGADRPGPADADAARRIAAATERDLDPGRDRLPFVVASSRLDPKKNHLGLVRAFADDAALRARANLLLVTGALEDPLHDDGPAGADERAVLAEIRAVVAAAGLDGTIAGVAIPGQPALAGAYRHLAGRRAVFALTALYEPFGLAPLEAAAAGLPVVVTRNGGPRESLVEGDEEYGVLVDPADPADVARGLRRLLDDPAAWDRFAAAGRRRVLDRYTWERTAAGYAAGLDAAIADPGARRPERLLPIHPYFGDPEQHAAPPLDALQAATGRSDR